METEQKLHVLQQVADAAGSAGLRGKIVEHGVFEIACKTAAGRRLVLVHPCARTPDAKTIVSVLCHVRVLTTGMLFRLSKEQALELLTMNEQFTFARLGIVRLEHGSVVTVSCDLILETLAPRELYWRVQGVAAAADRCEKTLKAHAFEPH